MVHYLGEGLTETVVCYLEEGGGAHWDSGIYHGGRGEGLTETVVRYLGEGGGAH